MDSRWLAMYPSHSRQPFVPAGSSGPWVVTSQGGVVFDCGGYGMLSFGHNPKRILHALCQPQHQANLMTRNPAQAEFAAAVEPHISTRQIACLNSGSEANSLALRIANTHKSGDSVVVALKGSFHGRTEGPAGISDSSAALYSRHLASYPDALKRTRLLEPNDVQGVHQTFDSIKRANQYVECAIVETVMGEGRPATAITPDFYDAVQRRVQEAGGLMIVDSVQSGMRCNGWLSIMQMEGFGGAEPPDVESFAKAVHAGQFPVSFVALSQRAAERYAQGTYGNTTTATPRALAVMTACLRELTPDIQANIRSRGEELLQVLRDACDARVVKDVRGIGLLLAIQLHTQYDVMHAERMFRNAGLNVIHGGENCIRLTPWFLLSSEECTLIGKVVHEVTREMYTRILR